MSTLDILMAAAGLSASSIVVSDVFATALYTGNGSSQTINNGINLSGNGGLVWIKCRSAAQDHRLTDTVVGGTKFRVSNSISADATFATATTFNSNGFTTNESGTSIPYTSWTFRKAPKFFDVVTWTGDNTTRNISHSLGITPGMIVVKRTDTASTRGWVVWHTSTGGVNNLLLNTTAAAGVQYNGRISAATNTNFTVQAGSMNNDDVNATDGTYVAYLFAHGTGVDGIIQCGSFTLDSSGNASINLGYRPQFVLFKLTSISGNWVITDSARGMPTGTGDKVLLANSTAAETTTSIIDTSSTGFSLTGMSANATGIYMAIKSAV